MRQSHYFIIVLIASIVCISSSVGRNDKRAGAPGDGSCNACHSGGSTSGTTALQGLPNTYVAGEEYDLILAVQDGSMQRAGFQIVATDGTSSDMVGEFTPGNNSRFTTGADAGRLTHSSPLNETNGIVEFNFKWKAPSNLQSPPDNIVFYYNMVAANGNGGTSGDGVYQGSSENQVLPIRLSAFDVKQDGRRVALNWSVLEADADSKFEIERSTNAIEGEAISTVYANSGNNDFSYIDTDPLLNVNSYYRLRMVDEDGLITYSEWLNIYVKSEKRVEQMYPNPMSIGQPLHVVFKAGQDINAEVIVYDMKGSQIQSINQRYYLKEGQNDLIIRDLNLQKSGMYTINVVNADTQEILLSQRLIYQGVR